jgi:hypothetical protein
MSISSSSNLEEKREEAIKLFISAIQFPLDAFHLGDAITTELIRGADMLLRYVQDGTIPAGPQSNKTDA